MLAMIGSQDNQRNGANIKSDCVSCPFPVHATIAGVAVVTIPLADYTDLIDKKVKLVKIGKAERYPVPPRSPIEVDAEVKAFFMKRLGKAKVFDLLRECQGTFGKARTPSRTAAYAFWKRLRDKES